MTNPSFSSVPFPKSASVLSKRDFAQTLIRRWVWKMVIATPRPYGRRQRYSRYERRTRLPPTGHCATAS